jgi:phytoene desaturase
MPFGSPRLLLLISSEDCLPLLWEVEMGQSAIVIGGGFGGLAAAARLRARGYDTTLVEKLDQLGGRATVYRRNGYVFDAGPTIITAPFLFEELFALFGKRLEDYVDIQPVYPWYRIRFEDGDVFNYGGTLEQQLEEVRRIEPADVDGYRKLLARTQKIFEVGFEQLGDQPFHNPLTMVKIIPHLFTLESWVSVYGLVKRYIKSPKLRQVCSFHPLLVGGNPFSTTCIYTLIHYLERKWGVHFAMGGTGAMVTALQRLLEEEGVDIRLSSPVEQILVEQRNVSGVRLASGEELKAQTVVCNADAPWVYKNLLASEHRRKWTDRAVERMKYSMGLFVWYFGTKRTYPELAHHTILLGPRYRGLLDDIFNRKILADDFSLYLHAPTRTDPALGPEGCETFYVLAPVPNLQGEINWATEGPALRERVGQYLEDTLIPGLSANLTEDFYVTPEHFRDQLNTLHGTGFSVEPTFTQSAYFRFHNKSEDVRNLYFVGAGTHPGAGMPGVLTSAKVLDRLIPAVNGHHLGQAG